MSFVSICCLLPPSAYMRRILSGSVSIKPVYIFMMVPNTATETAVTIMAFGLLPSHTISIGASADFGRLFNTIRNGSSIFERTGLNHSIIAILIPRKTISAKLISVSANVTQVWYIIEPSINIFINVFIMRDGELNINASIICSRVNSSHNMMIAVKSRIRAAVIIRFLFLALI